MPDPTTPEDMAPIDERAIRAYRLQRLRRHLAEADVAGILLTDPINLRYATGSRNMQVWTMHNFVRYAFVAADGLACCSIWRPANIWRPDSRPSTRSGPPGRPTM